MKNGTIGKSGAIAKKGAIAKMGVKDKIISFHSKQSYFFNL